jgi:signal transduction histidine kinase
MATESALSTLSRYEALFELFGEVNTSTEIAQVGELLARRLKYVADVFSWRYFSLEAADSQSSMDQRVAIVVDGYRGKAAVDHIPVDRLCNVELELWSGKKSRFLEGDKLEDAKRSLPEQFHKPNIVQIYVCPRFGAGTLQSMVLYSKVRKPFNELDVKFLGLTSQIFHDKVYRLWEHQKLRKLETAYLQQEITLRQNEKLATLGKLSAGMAHELNNPAAAAQRGAEQMADELDRFDRAQRALGETSMTDAQSTALDKLLAFTMARVENPRDLDPVTRSDLESDIEGWLEDHGVAEPWEFAPTLAAIGLEKDALTELAQGFGSHQLSAVVASLSSIYSTRTLVEEIQEGAGRISQIVKALKSYTYLDQAPIQSIDVHEGLNDTLVMLRSKLKDGITIRREYDTELPQIQAFGTELNQVWTNIIDNAISAMQGSGELTLRTYRDDQWVVVVIKDTGSGIAADIQAQVFDPFFTTKPPGEGTGLGLNISHNIIVQKHKGQIEVRSRPGDTRFEVRLPLDHDAAAPEDENVS